MKNVKLKECEAFQALEPKQKKFVLEYFKCRFNGQEAATKAGYAKGSARSKASQLLTNENIQKAMAEIQEQLNQADIASIEEIAQFLTTVMRGNIKDVVSWSSDGLVFTASSEEMDEHRARIIKRVKVTEKTSQKGDWTECKTEVELHDPVYAAELLGKYHGMFKEKVEHSGSIAVEHSQKLLDAKSRAEQIRAERQGKKG